MCCLEQGRSSRVKLGPHAGKALGGPGHPPHDRSHEEVMLLLPSKVRTSLEDALRPLFLHVQSEGGSRDAGMSLAGSSDCGHSALGLAQSPQSGCQ